MIAIIDYGMGNVRSLKNAFEYLGEDVVVTNEETQIKAADRLVLPGVGAFGDAMEAIRKKNLYDVLKEQAKVTRKPVLGICLGMQLFATRSFEHGCHAGLGWINADVRRIDIKRPLKVPHVGWNNLHFPTDDWLFAGIKSEEANFYFVHSYHMSCSNPNDLLATTDYGMSIAAVVRSDNLLAIQFHPEKSQDNGLQILENWVNWRTA